jgi:Nif-specific regulatory protein
MRQIDPTMQTELAREIHRRSSARFGVDRAAVIIGRHATLSMALDRLVRFAAADGPVLITGETGTGKELFARALFVSAGHHERGYLAVNCAQYVGEQLVASELFGHRRGSFTGAVADHRGVFEEADGGTVFLDEIGDLPLAAQAMLLRVLSEGEIVPVGGTRPRSVDVRVVAASSRDLAAMVATGAFRKDLYYRLRCLPVHVPPLRERGDDWQLIARYVLQQIATRTDQPKRLSSEARQLLRGHSWPGNVREVRSCMEVGFHVSEDDEIHARDFWEALEHSSRNHQVNGLAITDARTICDCMDSGEADFWQLVHDPFLSRELNRAEVRAIVAEGLTRSLGSYKRLLGPFGIADSDYLKFMDFLRHHRLKPSMADPEAAARRATHAPWKGQAGPGAAV